MAVWPVSLPAKPLQSAYSETAAAVVIRTEMMTGPAKTRRRFTAGVRPVHYEEIMTVAQLTTFRTFFDDTCEGGAVEWTYTHPIFSGGITMRFVGQPTWVPLSGTKYRVAFDAEVMP